MCSRSSGPRTIWPRSLGSSSGGLIVTLEEMDHLMRDKSDDDGEHLKTVLLVACIEFSCSDEIIESERWNDAHLGFFWCTVHAHDSPTSHPLTSPVKFSKFATTSIRPLFRLPLICTVLCYISLSRFISVIHVYISCVFCDNPCSGLAMLHPNATLGSVTMPNPKSLDVLT